MNQEILAYTARALVAPPKGVLSLDGESACPDGELFNGEFCRLLLKAPLSNSCISGVALPAETFLQLAHDDWPNKEYLNQPGTIIGVRADQGQIELPEYPDESCTEGIDGLTERLTTYRKRGAHFACWKSIFRCGEGLPSKGSVKRNAELMAQFALTCQATDLVPMVHMEIDAEGPVNLDEILLQTDRILNDVFAAFAKQNVWLKGVLIKMNIPGIGPYCPQPVRESEIALATLEVLRARVPEDVPGILFTSGGRDSESVEQIIELFERLSISDPWQITFAFGRALSQAAATEWHGRKADIPKVQAAFLDQAMAFREARCAGITVNT